MRTREFVEAARALGASDARIIVRHIVPNLFQSAVVIGTFAMASAIISEAALELPWPWRAARDTDLGKHACGRPDLYQYILVASVISRPVHLFTVLGINLLGDGLRDLLDPRLKRSGTGIG